jgi:hypothetical protein
MRLLHRTGKLTQYSKSWMQNSEDCDNQEGAEQLFSWMCLPNCRVRSRTDSSWCWEQMLDKCTIQTQVSAAAVNKVFTDDFQFARDFLHTHQECISNGQDWSPGCRSWSVVKARPSM